MSKLFVSINRPGQENKVTRGELLHKTINEIKQFYSAKDETIALVTPIYEETFDDEELKPFEIFPDLLLESQPDKYLRPSFYLKIIPKQSGLTLYIKVKCQECPNFPDFPVFFDTTEYQTTQNLDICTVISHRFPYDFTDPKYFIGDDEINPEGWATDLFDAAHERQIIFECTISEKHLVKISRRVSVLKEIISTEETYLRDLTTITNYWEPNITKMKVLAKCDLDMIFKDIPSIIICQRMFLESMKNRGEKFDSMVSDVFIEFSNLFKATKGYIASYSQITEILNDKMLKKSSIKRDLDNLAENNPDVPDRDLSSYLITPVQRMPRYILFLRELSKYTPASHPDFDLLQMATCKINEVTIQIDSETKASNNFVQLMKKQNAAQCAEISRLRVQISKMDDEITKLRNQTTSKSDNIENSRQTPSLAANPRERRVSSVRRSTVSGLPKDIADEIANFTNQMAKTQNEENENSTQPENNNQDEVITLSSMASNVPREPGARARTVRHNRSMCFDQVQLSAMPKPNSEENLSNHNNIPISDAKSRSQLNMTKSRNSTDVSIQLVDSYTVHCYSELKKLSNTTSKIRKEKGGCFLIKKSIKSQQVDKVLVMQNMLSKRHPCIAIVSEICADEDHPSVISEYFPLSVPEVIAKGTISLARKAMIILETAYAIRFLNENGITNRNLKAENVLLTEWKHARIVDFGIYQDEPLEETLKRGNIIYLAPEILNGKEYNQKADVYSFGIFMYYVIKGKLPEITTEEVKKGAKIKPPEEASQVVQELFEACTSFEPKNRPAFSVILYTLKFNSFAIYEGLETEFIQERIAEIEKIEQSFK